MHPKVGDSSKILNHWKELYSLILISQTWPEYLNQAYRIQLICYMVVPVQKLYLVNQLIKMVKILIQRKKKELQEKLQKTDRALERLKKAYLFDDDAMDEKEFLEMKTKLEVDKVKLGNSIKSLDSSSISENVDQAAFIKSASQFLISHKINSGGNIEYSELAMMDEEAMKTLMNSIIDHITVMDRHITEIVFKNGLTHTLLYR